MSDLGLLLLRFWLLVEVVAWLGTLLFVIAAVIVLTRPHAGHRGPVHWEAATILLFASIGLNVLASVARFTSEAIAASSALPSLSAGTDETENT